MNGVKVKNWASDHYARYVCSRRNYNINISYFDWI